MVTAGWEVSGSGSRIMSCASRTGQCVPNLPSDASPDASSAAAVDASTGRTSAKSEPR